MKLEILQKYLTLRAGLLRDLDSFSINKAGATRELLIQWLADVEKEWPVANNCFAKHPIFFLYSSIKCFINLCSWVENVLAASPDTARFLEAAKANAIVVKNMIVEDGRPYSEGASSYIDAVLNLQSIDGVETLARQLISIPVPISNLEAKSGWDPFLYYNESKSQPKEPLPIIKVLLEVDGQPWSNPQMVCAGEVCDLHARVLPNHWPSGSTQLSVDYLSTLPPNSYDISSFSLECPKDRIAQEVACKGHILFNQPQSLLAEPAIIRVRASFLFSDRSPLVVPVIGYHELTARVIDKHQAPMLSGYRSLDVSIVEIVNQIRAEIPDISQSHLQDFVGLLRGLSNFVGSAFQEAMYREGGEKVAEASFHLQILRHLRAILGAEVEEGTKRGGGPTDVAYRSVIAELKVEKKIKDVDKIKDKYLGQPTQYSSGSGAQLGITCVLDLTTKDNPLGVVANYISLETPVLHGFQSDKATPSHPTKIAFIIVPGNLKSPSKYSR